MPIQRERRARAVLAQLRHELLTPINAIIGYSELLMEEDEAAAHPDTLDVLARIRDEGRRILELVKKTIQPSELDDEDNPDFERFGAAVRHKLRTPLTAVLGYAEILLEDSDDEWPSCDDVRRIHESGKKLLAYVDDIVQLARIEMGRIGLDPSEFEAISGMVDRTIKDIEAVNIDDGPRAEPTGDRILVVDDHPVNRDLLSRRLSRHGYAVDVACDGREALEMARSVAYDLVLLDVVLPDISGYEVLQTLKSEDSNRHVPVVMISALDELDSVVRCIESGAEDYLTKPFSPVLLRARIGASLEKKHLRDREQEALRQLRIEKQRSDQLLLSILPTAIADRLKAGERTIADSFADVTVLFADLVGFTQLSSNTTPEDIVQWLNHIFTAFDELASRLGLEKIKTIGDAYMVAGGLPVPRADHAEAIAELALGMRDAMHGVQRLSGQKHALRIGINSGPVVAGVIGMKKFIYDLWGDTVNVASRMESQGAAGEIQVAASTYEHLKGKYDFQSRGFVPIRGRGRLQTYYLLQRKAH